MFRRTLQNIRTDVPGKAPAPNDILFGEIAVNYAPNSEKLYIKNSAGSIISFIDENEINRRLAEAETYNGIMKVITDNEKKNSDEHTLLSKRIDNAESVQNTQSSEISANTDNINIIQGKINEIDPIITSNHELANFLSGSNKITTLSNVPIDKRLVVSTISANASFTLSGIPGDGREIHTMVKNNSAGIITVALPTNAPYVVLGDETIEIAAGKYCEINALSDGNNIYLRMI